VTPRFNARSVLAGAAGATVVVGAGVGMTLQAAEAPVDQVAVKKAVQTLLEDNEPMGPTLVRLAWHAAGTFDKNTGIGAPRISARTCCYQALPLTLCVTRRWLRRRDNALQRGQPRRERRPWRRA
jgi:hypothetical protein